MDTMPLHEDADAALALTMRQLEALTRVDERRICVRAIRAEAMDYKAAASQQETVHDEAEFLAVSKALYRLADVIEGRGA